MLNLLAWLFFGLIVGALARLFMPGRDAMGWLATLALGVAGSILGGFVTALIVGGSLGAFQPASFLGSLIGAIFLLWLLRKTGAGSVSGRA